MNQSPGHSERFKTPIDIDLWNATLKPSSFNVLKSTAAAGGETRTDRQPQQQANTPNPLGYPTTIVTSPPYDSRAQTPSPRTQTTTLSRADTKSHHRQTSIVHGYQHSRNGSYASLNQSPLSPQIIAAAGGDNRADAFDMADSSVYSSGMSTLTGGGSFTSSTTLTSDRSAPPISIENDAARNRVGRSGVPRSGSTSRDYRHQKSNSRQHHKEELKTVGEFALQVLFNSFLQQAEEKLAQCVTVPLDPEPHIDQLCGPGADPTFDQLIAAMGHIARPKPKLLIDMVMLWRKNKSDAANEARAQLQQSKVSLPPGPMLRRNTEPPNMLPETLTSINNQPSLATRQEYVARAERCSTASIYILCRVLIEVIRQSTLASIGSEMEEKLEGIIFGQLKNSDPETLMQSPLRMANWFLFSELLGVMSEIDFASVSVKFISDIDRSQKELTSVKSPGVQETEGKLELVIGGMKYLRLSTHSEQRWEQSCNFMISLGRLFARSHGHRMKYAFCQALEILLLPIAAQASTELNDPKWTEVLSTISPRLASMFIKPRHWSVAFPLTATMLCVSSTETFASQWSQLILPLQPKFKDRFARPICLQVISRLLWTYLYRTVDTPSNTSRKLDEIIRLVLPPGRRTYITTEATIADPLIQIIRMIGFKHQEFCFKSIIFPLINADLFASGRELKVEQLEPEKMVIGIRAFLAIISDLEKGEQGRPPFPQHYKSVPTYDRLPTSPIMTVPKTASGTALPAVHREERLSRPVLTSVLSDVAKEYYARFSEILGKITIICDNTFGGQATLDEKFNSPIPKTPMAETFNFARRDEHSSPSDQKQGFFELLHVAVQALPRCLSAHIPFNALVNLLCTGTAHVQYTIAESSTESLKSIARQSHAQQVTIGFARFIFNFDDRYSTMSDGGMLGPGHIESTLKLYVELLQIWIEEIKQKTKEAALEAYESTGTEKRGLQLDLSVILHHVDEVESHGLFFLCSQSRHVRGFAITVLRLIKEFDTALGKSNGRLIDILDGDSMSVMNFNEDNLSVAERSRLQRGMKKSNSQSALIELCSSDVTYDTTLWFKLFPNLIRICNDRCQMAVTVACDLICGRILQMYRAIVALSEPTRGPQYGSYDRFEPGSGRLLTRSSTTPPEVLVEQWKLYLIVACTTLPDKGNQMQPSPPLSSHTRKGSKPGAVTEKISSARSLFKYIIPLLSVNPTSIREAVVVALGSINVNIYRTLLEELQTAVKSCNEEGRTRIHQRSISSPRRNRRADTLRTEIAHVYCVTSIFLKNPDVYEDDWILNNLVHYTKDLKLFLNDGEVQMDWEFQKLRRHYCGLMEELFEGINRTKDPSRWMSFEARRSSFALMENWCGYSPNQTEIRQREESMRQSIIEQQSIGERSTLTAAMEIERRNLRTAALSAMASLCGGPLSITTESKSNLTFDIRRMLSWIETIFNTASDRMQVIGRRALKNVITHNKDYPELLEHSIARCYLADIPKVLENYFSVVTEVVVEHPDYPAPFWRLMGIGLYTLGSETSEIRSKSAHVLRILEERQQKSSKIQDYDIRVSDKTKAVYKLAQFEISSRLSIKHGEWAFMIFSEFTAYFKDLQPNSQRNMVAAILPWVQIVELQVDPNGGPTAQSYVLLANLFELTIKASSALHNEVEGLWRALATGPHPGNVQLVLDFIMSLCLDRREQNFVEYAKQIVVFLSSTPAGIKVVEFLLMQITPKAMIPNEKREQIPPPPDAIKMPYVAELSDALPIGAKQSGFSLGQLSLILLVDLMVSPVQIMADHVPLLLQVVTILWDHYIPLVQEQAREMLVHLIHELVISQIDDERTIPAKRDIEEFIDSVRKHDARVVWGYEDQNGKFHDQDNKVPSGMEHLTTEVVRDFTVTYPGIQEQWARLALSWATSCPVRHLACRSFQVFRCILTSLDQAMLADMLARLSNTIADDDADVQTFSMEILTTLKTLIFKLSPSEITSFPQLFWTTCACLDSINEREFLEALIMLEELLNKLNFSDEEVRFRLQEGRPPKWEGSFEGLQPLVHKGARSSLCYELSIKTINTLVQLPNDELIGGESRLLFAILANFPRFLHAMDQDVIDVSISNIALMLADIAAIQGCDLISRVLAGYAESRYRVNKDFLAQLISAIRETFLPQREFETLTFLMGLLTNNISWVRINTMRILCVIIPDIDMRKPEIASHGQDLISPLLRLLQSTEFCVQALEVLDHIMTMTSTSMERSHVRMSMMRPSIKARKEYERTQSLFGLPEESGWSIPVPAKHAETTRANVHAAFYMCQSAENVNLETLPTPDVEFHEDDFQYGYFPTQERADTMMSDEGRGDGNISDLVTKLDSLDDFFEDNLQSPISDGRSSRTITEAGFLAEGFESNAQIYDEQTLPIYQQSIAQTSSNATYQNGFADRQIPVLTSSNAMNPGAFSNNHFPSINRPSLHSRSVTSPSAPSSQTHPAYLSDDDYTEEVFSDDERSGGGGGGGGGGSFFLENMIKPISQGARSGVRRLTGGRSKDGDRFRDTLRVEGRPTRRGLSQPPKSPRVPRVPSMYLAAGASGSVSAQGSREGSADNLL